MADVRTYDPPPREGPEGIGGWLILPTIGLFLTPLQGLIQLGQYAGLSENFQFLTGAQKTLVGIEIIGNLAIAVVMPVYLLFLLFNKKATFPRTYVIWAVANLIFIIADLIAAKILFGDVFEAAGMELMDSETTQAILRAIVLVAIWVPYMLNSRRVRNTFVQ